MDQWRAIIGKAEQALRPGRNRDPGAEGFARPATFGPAGVGYANQYVTWSGTTATVHTRLLLGVVGHGLGSELV